MSKFVQIEVEPIISERMFMENQYQKKEYYNYVCIFVFPYAAIGFLNPLLGQYLHSISFSGFQIGVVTSLATLTGIVASLIWGELFHKDYDFFGTRALMLLCFSAAVIVLFLMNVEYYVFFLICYCFLAFFQMPVMPLCDALALESGSAYNFGAIRKWGAVGFGVAVLISGKLGELFGLKIIFPLYSLGFILTGWMIFQILKGKRGVAEANIKRTNENSDVLYEAMGKTHKRPSYGILLKNKKLMLLLLSAFFVCGTNVANNTYFGFLYINAGGTVTGIGVAFLLMVGSEVPFMAWTHRISEKLTLERTILIAMCISAGRYFFYSTEPPYYMLIATFFLQGMVNGVILVEFVHYINIIVKGEIIGMAMTLYQALSSNCSTIICQFFGGTILDAYNAAAVYLFFGCYNLVGIALYLICGLYKPNIKSKT